jgi:predicted DNA-binding transcriptional regulator YafY
MAQTIKELINLMMLLHSRISLSIADIARKFNISERTAFRHIERLSRAGVPVYYDRKLKGYRLLRDMLVKLSDLSLNEAILLLSGLKLLSDCTNDNYKAAINALISKIVASQNIDFEEVWNSVTAQCGIKTATEDSSSALTNVILQMAIRFNKQAYLEVKNADDNSTLRVRDISLLFEDEMLVRAKRGNVGEDIEMSSILFAQLL